MESCLKEKRMAKCITPSEGCWLQYQLKLNGFTHHTVAKEANVTKSMVSHFLCGDKDSNRVRTALCKVLGYRSFESLIKNDPQESEGGAA
jgi:predicted transcriptional regulator